MPVPRPSLVMLVIALALLVLPTTRALADPLADYGGQAGLARIVDTFLVRLQADPRIGQHFQLIDAERFKTKLAEQFCAELGGPCTYTGRDMRTVHAKMQLRMSDFTTLVEVLQAAMRDHDIPFRAQNRLLAELAPMYRDMVGVEPDPCASAAARFSVPACRDRDGDAGE